MKQLLLRTIGALGVLVFVPLFSFTFADPQLIETSARSFVEWKLTSETNEKVDSIRLPKVVKLEKMFGSKAEKLHKKAEEKLADLKLLLKEDIPEVLASQIAKMRNLSCECRKKWQKRIRDNIEFNILSLEQAKSKLVDFSQLKYMQIVEKLTLDVRVFLGVNAVVYVLLLLISFLKPNAIGHLFLPGILMIISTLICSYFYLFEQNWFFTIIYDDYTGLGFLAYLMVVFAFLCDITFNKARVTCELLNSICSAIGSGASFSPC